MSHRSIQTTQDNSQAIGGAHADLNEVGVKLGHIRLSGCRPGIVGGIHTRNRRIGQTVQQGHNILTDGIASLTVGVLVDPLSREADIIGTVKRAVAQACGMQDSIVELV